MTATGANPLSTSRPRQRGPITRCLDAIGSLPFGITLLSLLFVYSSIGSAGLWLPASLNIFSLEGWVQLHVRQYRLFEMTEYEWFHYWPFNTLIALICLSLITATLRRIPFRPVNYGVWMIHSGIIILAVSSVVYFTAKVEGDTPVVRRRVVIELPGLEPVTLTVIPGNRQVVGVGERRYVIEVVRTDPQWELLSGDDKGKRVYSVTLRVQSSSGEFMRQLVDGYPQYTEDLVRGDDPQQPFARAKKVTGEPLVDDVLRLSLDYDRAEYVYLANNIEKSWALYLRPLGSRGWVERPIDGLPLYNDYIASRDDVWLMPEDAGPSPHPLEVIVPPAFEDDPLPDLDLRITSYLRYAQIETRRQRGGDRLDPAVSIRLENVDGDFRGYDLVAFDPAERSAEEGRLQFRWIGSEAELDTMMESRPGVLTVTVPGTDISIATPVTRTARTDPELEFTVIEGTGYSYRVESREDALPVRGRVYAVAVVEIRRDDERFLRWVFNDPELVRDLPAEGEGVGHPDVRAVDQGISMAYRPGSQAAPVTVVAGPAHEDLSVLLVLPARDPELIPLEIGTPVSIGDRITLTATSYAAMSRSRTRPLIVPRSQRDKDAREQFAMVRVESADAAAHSTWAPYHHYPFEDVNETLRRFPYRPALIELADGRAVEVILSRKRQRLPAEIVLQDFEVQTHVGGFTGNNISVQDWYSQVRFAEGDGWSTVRDVSLNAPAEYAGYWYFQAQWDPPAGPRFDGDPPSAGYNYTVLGVGNRRGVYAQLAGCIVAVIGMMYAFYVKPVIKRRRRNAAGSQVRENGELQTGAGTGRESLLVTAGSEEA